jgi:hypothetical protein
MVAMKKSKEERRSWKLEWIGGFAIGEAQYALF